MNGHPIEILMETAMNSIKDMVDVNTIIGEPIETKNGMVIIPISKVSFGFAAGGSEFKGETVDEYKKKEKEEEVQYRLPFGGGSGAGISINPVAFVVVTKESIKVLPIEHTSAIDKLMDYVPDLMEKANNIVDKSLDNNSNNFSITSDSNSNLNSNQSSSNQEDKEKKQKIKNPIINKQKTKKIKNNLKNNIDNEEKDEDFDEYFGEEDEEQ